MRGEYTHLEKIRCTARMIGSTSISFRISKRHVRCINGLLLDHAFHGSRLVFNNQDTFLDLMEWFLTELCEVGKNIDGEDRIPRLRYLFNLTRFMEGKGRDIQLIYNLLPIQTITDMESSRLRNIASSRMLEEMMTGNTTDSSRTFTFDGIYEKLGKFIRRIRAARKAKTWVLGGTQASFAEDMDQPILMLSLLTRISDWSRGIPETVRHGNHNRIVDAYQRLPCRRFWMYLKRIRFTQSMQERGIWSTEHPSLYDDQNWRGPEDLFTYGQSSYSQLSCFFRLTETSIAYPLIQPYKLNTTMYKAFVDHINNSTSGEKTCTAHLSSQRYDNSEAIIKMPAQGKFRNGGQYSSYTTNNILNRATCCI